MFWLTNSFHFAAELGLCVSRKMATLDGDLNDSLTETEPLACSPENATSQSSKESKNLIERDGEIGSLKNNVFRPMTNFSVRCVGYVVDDDSRTGANGFLFSVIPKDQIQTDQEDDESNLW